MSGVLMRSVFFILLACLLEMSNASHVYQCWDGSWQETCPSSEGEALLFLRTFGFGFFLIVVVMMSVFCTDYQYYGYGYPYLYPYPNDSVMDASVASRVRRLEAENAALRVELEKREKRTAA
jgi:hypothetical protein